MPQCRSCEAPIVWGSTTNGKNMPLDEKPTPGGNMVLLNGVARVANDEDRRLHRPLYTSHFATCPDAPKFRRRT